MAPLFLACYKNVLLLYIKNSIKSMKENKRNKDWISIVIFDVCGDLKVNLCKRSLRLSECYTPFYYLCTVQKNGCLVVKLFVVIYFLSCLMSDEKKTHVNLECSFLLEIVGYTL